MMVHAHVHQSDTHPAAVPNHDRRRIRSSFSVEGQPVEFHVCCIRHIIVWQDRPLLHDDPEIVIDLWGPWLCWMNHKHPDHPHHFLHRSVRVIEKSARLVQSELVYKLPTGSDRRLADVWHAVHRHGNFKSVPVNAG